MPASVIMEVLEGESVLLASFSPQTHQQKHSCTHTYIQINKIFKHTLMNTHMKHIHMNTHMKHTGNHILIQSSIYNTLRHAPLPFRLVGPATSYTKTDLPHHHCKIINFKICLKITPKCV